MSAIKLENHTGLPHLLYEKPRLPECPWISWSFVAPLIFHLTNR